MRLLWLSVAAALATMALKTLAWLLTGSVGLLSDAAESLVNLFAALVAVAALAWAVKPPTRITSTATPRPSISSAGFEGALIVLAAVVIGVTATDCLLILSR